MALSHGGAVRDCTTALSMSAEEEHKYIIVGGGTAGCVLANRLSAEKVGQFACTLNFYVACSYYISSRPIRLNRESTCLVQQRTRKRFSLGTGLYWYSIVAKYHVLVGAASTIYNRCSQHLRVITVKCFERKYCRYFVYS